MKNWITGLVLVAAAGQVLAQAPAAVVELANVVERPSGSTLSLPGTGQPPRIFVLSPKSTFDEEIPVVDWQLLIDSPIAAGVCSR